MIYGYCLQQRRLDFAFPSPARLSYSAAMLMRIAFLFLVVLAAHAETAVSGQVLKVLPLFLDTSGRTGTSPSLFERDAYQVELRKYPERRSGIEFAVNWKAKGPKDTPLTLRIELRGGQPGQLPTTGSLEQKVTPKGGLFGTWTSLKLTGQEYKRVGDVNSWRATLWNGDTLVAEAKSFLWQADPKVATAGTNHTAAAGQTR